MTLLVLTAGQTDVQLVVDGGRRELRKDRCATLHAELERRSDWRVVEAPDLKLSDDVQELPSGALDLCTPKLDAVLRDLGTGSLRLTHALILETRRDPESERGDPRAAGLVLARRLGDRYGDSLDIQRSTLLEGRERLEDRRDPRDAVVRREIVFRLDQAIREAVAKVAGGRVVVATTGGMPAIASLAEEVTRLHAGAATRVDLLEVADGAKADPPTRDRAVERRSLPEPAESYRARRHSLELIDGGNLLGAWGAARHLHGDEVENTWTQIVEWLSRFAASLPISADCDIALLRHPRMAVRAAVRVELALRAGDIPRAVHGTVAFFEAALWDHLGERATRHADKKRLFKLDPAPAEDLVRKGEPYESKRAGDEDRKRPFSRKETTAGTDLYWIDDTEVCAVQLAKHYLKLGGLTQLGQAVSSDIRELRNDVAHNEPTPALMDDARRRMAAASLWSGGGTFLTESLAQDVLRELGEQAPADLCADLLSTVRARLLEGRPPRGGANA